MEPIDFGYFADLKPVLEKVYHRSLNNHHVTNLAAAAAAAAAAVVAVK